MHGATIRFVRVIHVFKNLAGYVVLRNLEVRLCEKKGKVHPCTGTVQAVQPVGGVVV